MQKGWEFFYLVSVWSFDKQTENWNARKRTNIFGVFVTDTSVSHQMIYTVRQKNDFE